MRGIEIQFFIDGGYGGYYFIPTMAFDICKREKYPYISILFIMGKKNKGIRFYRKDKDEE